MSCCKNHGNYTLLLCFGSNSSTTQYTMLYGRKTLSIENIDPVCVKNQQHDNYHFLNQKQLQQNLVL